MYKSKEDQKEANRKANQAYRDKQKGITVKGITKQGITPLKGSKNVTPKEVILSDGQLWHPDPLYYKKIEPEEPKPDYPAILVALTDPIKREKLERITSQLEAHGVSEFVRYGVEGPTFDRVGEIAACLQRKPQDGRTAKKTSEVVV